MKPLAPPEFERIPRHDVMVAVIYHDGKILVAKRSNEVGAYRGRWSGIAGYIEETKTLEELIRHEFGDELGWYEYMGSNNPLEDPIASIQEAEAYELYDPENNVVWRTRPVLVMLNYRPDITLDWEHTRCAWIRPEELRSPPYADNLADRFLDCADAALALLSTAKVQPH